MTSPRSNPDARLHRIAPKDIIGLGKAWDEFIGSSGQAQRLIATSPLFGIDKEGLTRGCESDSGWQKSRRHATTLFSHAVPD